MPTRERINTLMRKIDIIAVRALMALALGAVPTLAQNETTIAGPVIATGTFNSGKNGQYR
jgi:hypothetical protein